jgi:hypothetical protein
MGERINHQHANRKEEKEINWVIKVEYIKITHPHVSLSLSLSLLFGSLRDSGNVAAI